MSRERMVTRTVEMSKVEFMVLNIKTADVAIIARNIPGSMNEEEALNYARKVLEPENPTVKYVVCQSIEHFDVLYGMPESEFIARANVLPPRTTTK